MPIWLDFADRRKVAPEMRSIVGVLVFSDVFGFSGRELNEIESEDQSIVGLWFFSQGIPKTIGATSSEVTSKRVLCV